MHTRNSWRALIVALLAVLLWSPMAAAVADHKHGHDHDHDEPPTPTSPTCTPGPRYFHTGTHNVLHGSATFSPFAAVIGWQEVDRAWSHTKLRNQLGTAYRHYTPSGSAGYIPVSWRVDRFSYIFGRSVKTHEGLIGVSPDRWISIVHLRKRDSGQRVIVLNTHFVSEAFKEGSSYRAWRLDRWYRHNSVLRRELARVRYFHPSASIFLVGDFNRSGYLDYSPWGISPLRIGTSNPIDHMYAGLPGRGGCAVRLSQLGSDHYRYRATTWIG